MVSSTRPRLSDLSGLIAPETGQALAKIAHSVTLPQDHVIVELGSFKGKSACYLASSNNRDVYCVDAWDLPGNIYGKHGFTDPKVFETFREQVKSMGYENRITAIKGFAQEVAKTFDKPIAVLFIDASHIYEDVKNDYEAWIDKVPEGGVVIFDDYIGPNRGVTKFVNELKKDGWLQDWKEELGTPITWATVPKAYEVRLSVAIMAHPKRQRYMPYLLRKLGATQDRIVMDRENNRWDTGRRSQLHFDPDATHHVVVQDDAIVCEDFIEGLTNAIKSKPSHPISLYTGKVRPLGPFVDRMVRQAHNLGRTWIRMDGPLWGVAVCAPVHLIEDMVAACDKMVNTPNYDMRMVKYYQSKGIKCYYTIPSLVSHRVGADDPSLVPGRGSGSGRVAHSFIGEDESAAKIKWTRGYVTRLA